MSKPSNSKRGVLIHLADHPLTEKRRGLIKRRIEHSNNVQGRNEAMPGNTGPRRILIVEDDRSTRETIFEFLQTSGYECYSAGSAEEALEFLYVSAVDLVITDVMMPGRTGLELTEIIKRKTDSDVIIMTGYMPNCSYELAMGLGASGFFYKPIKLADMLRRVKSVLKNR